MRSSNPCFHGPGWPVSYCAAFLYFSFFFKYIFQTVWASVWSHVLKALIYFRCFESAELKGSHAHKSIAVVYILFRWCFLKNQDTLRPVFSHCIRVTKVLYVWNTSSSFPGPASKAHSNLVNRALYLPLIPHTAKQLWRPRLNNEGNKGIWGPLFTPFHKALLQSLLPAFSDPWQK